LHAQKCTTFVQPIEHFFTSELKEKLSPIGVSCGNKKYFQSFCNLHSSMNLNITSECKRWGGKLESVVKVANFYHSFTSQHFFPFFLAFPVCRANNFTSDLLLHNFTSYFRALFMCWNFSSLNLKAMLRCITIKLTFSNFNKCWKVLRWHFRVNFVYFAIN
jgi:hypothetical protein